MRIERLKIELAERIAPVYLVVGDDAYFRELAVKTITKKCVTAPDLNFASYDGKAALADQNGLVMAASQYPFMSEKRMIVVRDFYPSAKDLKGTPLDSYLKAPSDTTVFVIVNAEASDSLKRYDSVTVVDCGKADESVLTKYISVTLKRENLIITLANARLICELCRMDMTRISGEVEKLAAYCHGEAEVTEKDIRALVCVEQEYQLYELAEKVARRRHDEAYAIVSDMQSKSNDSSRLFSSLYNYFRRLFFCATSEKSDAALGALLGVKEYAIKKSREQAGRFSPKRLKQIVDIFSKYDGEFKSGGVTVDAALSVCLAAIME